MNNTQRSTRKLLVFFSALAAAILGLHPVVAPAAAAALPGEWPTFGRGPAHTSYFPGLIGNATFNHRWTTTNSGPTAIANGQVFVVGNGSLAALASTSGQVLWRYTFVPGTLSPPTYNGGAVYVQRGNHSGDTHLWSINAASGTTNWAAPYSEQWESHMAPVVADGKVWINGGYYGGIYAFNQTNGSQVFFQGLEQYDDWTPAHYNGYVYSWVEGKLREHDPMTGVAVRTLNLGWDWAGWSMNRTISIADGKVFCVGTNLYGVDLASFQKSWSVAGNFSSTPAIANGVVYALSNSVVAAFSATNGAPLGQYVADTTLINQAIITDDTLIVASSSKTYVFGLSDRVLKQTLPIGGSLSFANGTLFISGSGALQAYSVNDDVPLLVSGNPVTVGYPSPVFYGTNWLLKDQSLTASVATPVQTNGITYRCIGWSGTGSVPPLGTSNTVTLTLSTNSSLTWNWEAYQYLLQVTAAGFGSVNLTNQWYASNALAVLSATPQAGYRFDRWSGDVPGSDIRNNPLTLTMDRARQVTAVFASTNTARPTGDWGMFGRTPAHTGYVPGILGTNVIKPRWGVNLGGTINPVVTGNGRVYVSSSSFVLSALHQASGVTAWQKTFPSGFSLNPPSFDGGNVYVQRGNHSSDSQLFSVNGSSGAVNWQTPYSAQWESYMAPTIANGNIWVNGGSYGGMYGFNQSSGAQNFFVSLRQYDRWTPAYYNGKLYTYVGGVFQEHDASNGASLWSLPIGNESYGSYGYTATLVLSDNKGFFCAGTNITAVDLSSRQIAWRHLGAFSSFPAVANGMVYAISNNTVRAFNLAGSPTGIFTADATLSWQPIVTDDSLIVSSSSGSKTYIFNLFDYTLRQTVGAGGYLTLADGALYIASGGTVYSYSTGSDITLQVSGNPLVGSPLPSGYGTSFYSAGVPLTHSVSGLVETNGTRYTCTGWSGTGDVPATGSGTSVSFTLGTNSTLTWNWQVSQHLLQVTAAGFGSVNVPNQWYAANAVASVSATPQVGYRFDRWSGDLPLTDIRNNPVNLTMDRPRQLVAIFASTNTSAPTGNWAMFGRTPGHTGYVPGVLGTNVVKPRWNVNLGGTVNPVVTGAGRVFASSSTFVLSALHQASGVTAWQYSFSPGSSLNPPSFDGGNIYLQRGNHSSDSQIFSVNGLSGAVNWQTPFSAQWERYMAPTIANGNIWVNGGYYGGMYGFNQSSGAQKFFLSLQQYDNWTPAYDNGKLFTYVGGNFQEHDPATGTSLWNLSIGNNGSYGATATLVLSDNKAFFCPGTNITAVDVSTRQIAWRNPGSFNSFPAVANGMVYAISNNTVRAFNLAGSLTGTFTADAPLFWQPVVTDDSLIVSSSSGAKTYIFNLFDFTLRQTLAVGGYVTVADGALYIASGGTVYSYSTGTDVLLQVVGNPAVGSPMPAGYGTNFYSVGVSLTNSVAPLVETNGTRFLSTGWSGTGSVPSNGTGTSVSFTLSTNSTLTWNWRASEYRLTVLAAGPGTVNVTNAWYGAGTNATISATPTANYRFVKWVGDVPSQLETANPLVIPMNQSRRIVAYFASENQQPLSGDWSQFGRDAAHSGYFPGITGNQNFNLRWSVGVGGNLQQAAIGGNRIFVTPYQYFGSAFLSAVHEYTGKMLWTYNFASCYSINPPSYDAGSVFVQRGNHSSDTHLWNFDGASGGVIWKAAHSAQWERYMAPTVASTGIWTSGGYYGGMYGFNRADGAQRFFQTIGASDWTPTYYNGKVYVLSGTTLFELNPTTGATNWTLSLAGVSGVTTRVLSISDNRAYFCGSPGLMSIDLGARQLAWRVDGSFSGFPAVANGITYAISNSIVHAYTQQGQLVGRYTAPETLQWQPIVTDDSLIVASASKTYIFDLFNFSLRQTIQAGGYVSLANGVLYITTSGGILYAYSLGTDTRLIVRSSGGDHGNPFPFVYGTNLVSLNTTVNPSVQSPSTVSAGVRAVNTGWTGSGSVPGTGTSPAVSFVITNESTLTWQWKTQYFLNTDVVSNGVVDVADGWFDAMSNVTITATASNYFHFVKWAGAVSGTSNVIQVSLTGPMNVIAHFDADRVTNNTPTWWLVQNGQSPDNAGAMADSDNDGLANWQEFNYGANPNVSDTDSDGYNDGYEVSWNSSPTNSVSIPKTTLVIAGNPSRNGSPTPLGYGTNLIALLQHVTNTAPSTVSTNNGVRNLLLGWTGTGSVPSTGSSNSVSFFFETNSTLTWNWQKQCLLTVSNLSGGYVNAVQEIRDTNGTVTGTETSTNGWWNDGTLVTLSAVPSNYFRFVSWSGAVSGTTNPAAVLMSDTRSVGATFAANLVTNNVPEWWLAQNGLPISDEGALQDTDGDGLTNWQEFSYSSNPNAVDTDSDGYNDGLEVARGSNPVSSGSIPRVTLSITGQPAAYGTATPYNYGTHQMALFTTNTLTVSPIVDTGVGSRQTNIGWTGSGDVPSSGSANFVTITHNTNSTLTWRWQQQYLLSETKSFGAPAALTELGEQTLLQRPLTNAGFGWRIAAHSNYAVVGAPLETTNGLVSAGAAYIYRLTGTNWVLQARLFAPDNLAYNFFGCSVAIWNDVAVIGGYRGSSNNPSCTAYIYRRSGTSWFYEGKVITGAASENWYTCSVATDGASVAVAATADSSSAPYGGAVFVYRRSSTWFLEAKLIPNGNAVGYRYFGSAIALSNNRLLVGAYGEATNNVTSGSAYIFQRVTSWSQIAKIVAPEAASFAEFGGAVAIATNFAVIGAPYDEVGGVTSGSAYVYRNLTNNGISQWVREARLTSVNPAWNEYFGGAVSIQGSNILVAAVGGNGTVANAGNASIYQRSGTNWIPTVRLRAKSGGSADGFGTSVALNDSFALVGAPQADSPGRDSGLAYSFDWSLLTSTNATETWWNVSSMAQTSRAADSMLVSNVVYSFVRWEINGVRQANTNNEPANPAFVLMNQPARAVAVYWPRSADTDADTLPDWWEQWAFGNLAQSASSDSDNDGASNWHEWRAGTNPNSASSILRLSAQFATGTNGTQFTFEWPSAVGHTYRVNSSTNLFGSFSVVATNIAATPPVNTFTQPITNSGAFYRIEVE